MKCPRCKTELTETKEITGFYFKCDSCGGTLGNLSVLRRRTRKEIIERLNHLILVERPRAGHLPCSVCHKPMNVLGYRDDYGLDTELDFCPRCHFIWFDASELERIPEIKYEKGPANIPEVVPQKYRNKGELIVPPFQYKEYSIFDRGTGLFDSEISYGLLNVLRIGGLTGFCISMFVILALMDYEADNSLVPDLAFYPNDPFVYKGIGMLSSFFMQEGFIQTFINSVFAFLLIKRMESLAGMFATIAILTIGHFSGIFSDYLTIWTPGVYTLGANSGLSALAAFLLIRSPGDYLGFDLDDDIYVDNPLFLHLPVLVWGILWFGVQIPFLILGAGNTNAVSTIVSASIGFILGLYSKFSKRLSL